MGTKIYHELLDMGFSERFLKTFAGANQITRAVILSEPSIHHRCLGCQLLFAVLSEHPFPIFSRHGLDMRDLTTAAHRVGYCSSACAHDSLGDDWWNMANAALLALSPGFYDTKEWREVRYQAFVKHGARCQCCGATRTEAQLHVDHIKPRVKFPELALSLDNLQILCKDCNFGKSYKDQTDWRAA